MKKPITWRVHEDTVRWGKQEAEETHVIKDPFWYNEEKLSPVLMSVCNHFGMERCTPGKVRG